MRSTATPKALLKQVVPYKGNTTKQKGLQRIVSNHTIFRKKSYKIKREIYILSFSFWFW